MLIRQKTTVDIDDVFVTGDHRLSSARSDTLAPPPDRNRFDPVFARHVWAEHLTNR